MKLSIVVITWNSEEVIKPCLDSLLEVASSWEHEMIVIDNGSSDGTKALLRQYEKKILLVENESNLGVAKARNQGLKLCRGEYVWLVDSDTVVSQQAADALVTHLDSHQKTGICGCKLVSVEGEVQDSCRKLPALHFKILNVLEAVTSRFKYLRPLTRWLAYLNSQQFYHEQLYGDEAFEVGYLIGACQMFRRDVLDEVGFLDENIFYGPEDADFCRRIALRGWKVVYLPYVQMIHHYSRITAKRFFSRMSLLHLHGLMHYYIKHRSFV